ncbi:MAG: immunoglobulin domain-containing protein [Chitinophagaceae bacterium]|nr:immunoglobulin domain-containing protein [Chitinophagaceae bacterium]
MYLNAAGNYVTTNSLSAGLANPSQKTCLSALTSIPSSNSPVCSGSTLNLTGAASGGLAPYTYSWTGPNAFTSTSQNPSVTNFAAVNAGAYILTVTDANGCTATSSTTTSLAVQPSVNISFDQGSDQNTQTITVCGNIGGGGQDDIDIWSCNNCTSPTYQWEYSDVSAAGPWTVDPYAGVQFYVGSFSAVPGHYYFRLRVTSNGCSSYSDIVDLIVTGAPNTAPTGVGGVRCGTGTVALSASGCAGGTLNWYSTLFAGSFLGTGANFTTPSISATTTYYVSCTTSGCESPRTAVTAIVVNTATPPGAISGQADICVGATGLVYSITAMPGATSYTWAVPAGWTIVSGQGTVSINVTGGGAGQNGNISVTATYSCGTSTATTLAVTVTALPAVNLTSATVCVGSTTTVTPGSGGTWVSSNPAVATVNNAGLVTGISAGTATFTFTSSTAPNCSATTAAVTVSAAPVVGITGATNICVGSTTTLSPTTGGTWVSSNPAVATVTNGGVVTGVLGGSVTFTFTSGTAPNCSATTAAVTITPKPAVGIIGASSICIGGTTQLTPNSGGTWVSSNPGFATVSATGLVTGVSVGVANFTFTSSTAPNCAATTPAVFVNALPVCSISGTTSTCPGDTNTYSAPASMTIYNWTITGAGTIVGASNGQTVKVKAGCGSYTLFVTITNAQNCSSTCNQTYTVTDIISPTITIGTSPAGLCNPTAATLEAIFATTVISDNCPSGLTITTTDVGETFVGNCIYFVRRSWTVTDGCGNTVGPTPLTIFYKKDLIAPVITLPAAGTVPCNPTTAQLNTAFGTPTVTDNCTGSITTTFTTSAETGSGCSYSITRTWTSTDICGNFTTATRTLNFTRDTQVPVISVSASSPVGCNPTAAAITAAFGTASVTDNCSTGLTATFTDGPEVGSGCSFSLTRTWTVTDACGNIGTTTQTITFTRDTQAPVITVTSSTPVGCNPTAAAITAAFGTASVTDNCSTGLIATFTDGPEVGSGCSFSVTRTWTVTDACGNIGTATQTVTFTRDTQAPVITVSPSTPVGCNPTAAAITAAFGTASVTDNCSTGLTATFTDGSEVGSGCSFSVTRTWTVTDGCGNIGTNTQTITFTRDTQAPVITVTPSTPVGCNPTAAAITAAFGTASVTDNCSTGLIATFTDGPEVGSGCSFSVTRTWTVTDACGNIGTATQTVTFTRDTQAPVITVTPSTPVGCNPTAAAITAAFGTASVTDNCSTGLTATFTDGPEVGSGCSFSLTRTWTVTDGCGNIGTNTQTITFTRDTQVPVITVTPSTPVGCNPTAAAITAAFGTASVTDNCSTGFTATFTDGPEVGSGCSFSVTRTWTVTDACGNIGTTTQTITFTRDTQAPVITVTPSTPVGCNPTAAAITAAFGTASVTDNCSTGLTATFTDAPEAGSGCSFSVTRTWTVTDACGNVGTSSQTITFTRDTQAPVITVTPSSPVGCNPTAAAITAAFGTASVTDNCSTGLTATFTDGPEVGSGCSFSVTRTWTVTDACGNIGTTTQTITFTRDTQAPVITVTPSTPVGCNPTAAAITAAFGTASVTDNCSTGLTATFTDDPEVGSGCSFSLTRTWTVTDACGNVGSATQTITFTRDTQAPVITVTPSSPVGCNPTAAAITAAFGTAGVTDNCSIGLTATFTDGPEVGSGCSFSLTRTWTVTDACGNIGTASQTITFTRDTQAPVITVTPSSPVGCNPTAAAITAAFGTASVTDNCSTGLTATFTDGPEVGSGCSFSLSRTWTITDACGNIGTATQTITFTRDTQAPVITVTASSPVGCNPTAAAITAAFGTASVTDNCSTGLTATFTDGPEVGSGCSFSVTRTWTVTDACGNIGTTTQTITFTRDTQAPVITVTPSSPVGCNPTAAAITAAFGTASVTDNCSTGLTATFTMVEVGSGCLSRFKTGLLQTLAAILVQLLRQSHLQGIHKLR